MPLYLFLLLLLVFAEDGAGTGLLVDERTLEARELGAAEVALLAPADLTLSSALFYVTH